MRILHGGSDGSFIDTQVRLQGEPLLWADLDNDGDWDILATTRYGPGSSWIYWNQGATNYVQSEPGSLSTPNYNGSYILSASAADVDGDGDLDLLIATAYGGPVRLLRNDGRGVFTDTGTFYWSVQAVDNCYVGGPFAPEQHFVVNLPGNQPPRISEIAEQTMMEDSVVVVPFTVDDDRTPAETLQLRAFAANPFLLPSARMIFGGGGTNRTLTLSPGTNQSGQTVVTLEATDAVGGTATRSFLVTVANVNDSPFISAIPSQTNLYSAEPITVSFAIGDPETPPDQLQLSATAGDPTLVPSTNIVFGGTGANRNRHHPQHTAG